MKKFSLSLVWNSFKDAFKGFSEDKLTKLSASLAYYTVFSIGPLLIVLIFISGIVLGREAAEGTVYLHIQGLIGSDAAKQVEEVIKNASMSNEGGLAATIGVIVLLIGATTVFGEIQDSMNGIWGLKPKPKTGWLKLLKNRLLSFGILGSLAFILLVSLAVTSVIEGISGRLKDAFPDVTVVVLYVVNLLLTLGVTTFLFAIIFKVLPDAKIRWKDVWAGSVVTSLLFMLGKLAISLYISKSEIGSTYGSAGSLVVLLVWVYYSSIILYFGAEFTKSYVIRKGVRIKPNKYAVWNDEPVVPGAKPESGKSAGHPSSAPVPAYPVAMNSEIANRLNTQQGKPSAGIGTAIIGLLLYLVRTPSQNRQLPD